jgi:hypothetical protein
MPGEYDWGVEIVRRHRYLEPVSYESARYHFEILSPPIVHSILPTCTVKETSVLVTVTGENFTHSSVLTIDVPLDVAFVDSSALKAIVPKTLELGEYPVIVKNSFGQGDSFAFFTVLTPTPTPRPVTPQPVYPKPVLGGLEIHGHDVTFHWSLAGTLGANDYFALRVGIGFPGESKLWTKETKAGWRFTEQGEYVWEVAVCRGDPAEADCSGDKQLAVSEQSTFWFTPPDNGNNGDDPPPP